MKALVTYFSQTGNTKKIAEAIEKAVSDKLETVLKKMEDIELNSIHEFDIIFVGSPCHAGDLSSQAKEFLASLPDNCKCKISGFVTHAGSVYNKTDFEKSFETFKAICLDKGITVTGLFDCQGFLNPELHDFVKNNKKLTDEEWERKVEIMKGHPDETDVNNAKLFAQEMIKKL